MSIYFKDGLILFDSGSIAMSEDCCCGFCDRNPAPDGFQTDLSFDLVPQTWQNGRHSCDDCGEYSDIVLTHSSTEYGDFYTSWLRKDHYSWTGDTVQCYYFSPYGGAGSPYTRAPGAGLTLTCYGNSMDWGMGLDAISATKYRNEVWWLLENDTSKDYACDLPLSECYQTHPEAWGDWKNHYVSCMFTSCGAFGPVNLTPFWNS